MRRFSKTVLTVAAALLLSACGTDDPEAADPAGQAVDTAAIEVHDARSRMSPMVTGAAAIYLTLDNPTGADDALVGASVPAEVGAAVELHETYEREAGEGDGTTDDTGGMHDDMSDEGDSGAPMMAMREVDVIAIPAGDRVELRPGGQHLMVVDLVADLEVGDRFDVTLEFEHAQPVTVTVEVREEV